MMLVQAADRPWRETRAAAMTPGVDTNRRPASPSLRGAKRAAATPISIALVLTSMTAAALLPLSGASTSLPSSSSGEICPDETAACFDSPFCWDCVAQFTDGSDFCHERYPVLAAVDAGCETASALYCCSFDASGQDCVGDAVTMDLFRCALLEGIGCALSDTPCSGIGGGGGRPAPSPHSTAPAPVDDDIDGGGDGDGDIDGDAGTAPSSPAPTPPFASPSPPQSDADSGTLATNGAAGLLAAPPLSWVPTACWGKSWRAVLLLGALTTAANVAGGL